MKNKQKGTKESKLSLGSWLAFWAANMICTSMLDITFKLRRKDQILKQVFRSTFKNL